MKARFDATGEVLIVTGGASGIGAAVAQAYAAAGGQVVVLDVVAPGSPQQGVHHIICDVANRDQVFAAVADVIDRHGRVDGLVTAAAVQPRVPVSETDAHTWQHVIDVNLNGVVWACQAALPSMRAAGRGAIVVFGSGLGVNGRAEASAYAATKGAMVSFAKSLAAETATDGVRVNILFPGGIDTEQFQRANPPGPEREFWERTIGIGQPADVVGPLMFLLSDAGSMTGSVLSRDRAFGVQS